MKYRSCEEVPALLDLGIHHAQAGVDVAWKSRIAMSNASREVISKSSPPWHLYT